MTFVSALLPDIDECRENPQICGSNAVCNNQPGTFRCECSSGYVFASDGKTCIGRFENLCVCVCVCGSLVRPSDALQPPADINSHGFDCKWSLMQTNVSNRRRPSSLSAKTHLTTMRRPQNICVSPSLGPSVLPSQTVPPPVPPCFNLFPFHPFASVTQL